MRKIVYYVASSPDGYIAGPDADISMFVSSGNGVDQYLADLARFDTVIMGRKTYEFGYRFGLEPGQPAYAHMQHYIFSETLQLETLHPQVHIVPLSLSTLDALQQQDGSPIYLCGGGQLAGWLLDHHRIDELILKLNPFVQGAGTRLFGDSVTRVQLQLTESRAYDHGLQIMKYRLHYP